MTKIRAKLCLLGILLPIVLVLTLASFVGLSRFIAYFQQGADPVSIFRGNELTIPDETQAVWLSTTPKRGITPTKGQQEEIIAHYWQAWDDLSRAYELGDDTNLSTHWALPALALVQDAIDRDTTQMYETSHHQLQLVYFSDDRSVAHLNDTFLVSLKQGALKATATTTLTLDDGRWRIRLLTIHNNN